MNVHRTVGILPLVVLCACDPFAFNDYEKEAGVVVLAAPDDYPRRPYGTVVVGYEAELDGKRVSRVAVSGGANTPFAVYTAWNGVRMKLNRPLFDGCESQRDCGSGTGTALAGIPVWRSGTKDEQRACLLISAPDDGLVRVVCETATRGELIMGKDTVELGASAVALPVGTPLGVALLGAPNEEAGGGLYRLASGRPPVKIELSLTHLPVDARLGDALDAAPLDGGKLLVALGAPGAKQVVVVVLSHDAATDVVTASVRACLEGEDDRYGSVVHLADLDRDGAPELLVGSKADGSAGTLELFSGSDLPDVEGCGEWGAAARTLECPDEVRGVKCDGFGAAVATGDLDGDGRVELLASAPSATVDGKKGAGAVYVFRGSASGVMEVTDVLTDSRPGSGDRLGASLAVVPSQLAEGLTARDEVVAGAPGAKAATVFLCSGLAGDDLENGDRCVATP